MPLSSIYVSVQLCVHGMNESPKMIIFVFVTSPVARAVSAQQALVMRTTMLRY